MKRIVIFLFVVVACVLYANHVGYCEDLPPAKERLAQEVFGDYMSPFCPGRLLANCPSSAAAELKDRIRQMIKGGAGRKELDAFMISQYGEAVKAAPDMKGFGLVAWLVPVFFLFIGALIISVWVWKRKTAGEVEQEYNIDTEVEKLLEKEL